MSEKVSAEQRLGGWLSLSAAIVIAVGLSVAVHGEEMTAKRPPPVEFDSHGAVLCTWLIYNTLERVGRACFANETAFNRELAEGIEAMDQFIVVNLPISADQLPEYKAKFIANHSQNGISKEPACSEFQPAELAFYQSARTRSTTERRRADIGRLLSIPRKPVLNPCM
jgi:hypothetical protein